VFQERQKHLESIADINSTKIEQVLILEKEKNNLEQYNLDLEQRNEKLEKSLLLLQEEKDENQLLMRQLTTENERLKDVVSELEKSYTNLQTKYQSEQEINRQEKENDKKMWETLMRQNKVCFFY
jgi:hypothetical protein